MMVALLFVPLSFFFWDSLVLSLGEALPQSIGSPQERHSCD